MRRIIGGQLQCTRCRETKPITAFTYRINGCLHSWCHECKKEHHKFYKRAKRAAERARAGLPPKPPKALRPVKRPVQPRLRTMWADKQFKLRMLAARNGGRERFVLGIERQAEG